jgi:hypothetical protein
MTARRKVAPPVLAESSDAARLPNFDPTNLEQTNSLETHPSSYRHPQRKANKTQEI